MSFLTGTQAELLYAMPQSGAAVTGTASSGSAAGGPLLAGGIANTFPAFQLPAYFFPDTYGVSRSVIIEGGGSFTIGTAAPTMKFSVYLDTAIGGVSTLLCATGAFTTTASVSGNWLFRILVTCTGVGTSGTLNTTGLLHWGTTGLTTTVGVPGYTMGAGTTTPITFNNSSAYYIEPYAFFSATTNSPTMSMLNFFVWGLN